MTAKRIVVLGAGGFAREVRWILRERQRSGDDVTCVGFVVTDLGKLGEYDSRELVLGDYSWIEAHRGDVDGLALGIGAPRYRQRVSAELCARFPEIAWPPVIFPGVIFDWDSCAMGRGVVVCPGVVGSVNVTLGEFSMVNYGCTVGHEAVIGPSAVVYPGANVGGGVVVGAAALIGSGAQVLQYRSVGEGAVVGAGAVVTRDVAPFSTVAGVPARPMAPRTKTLDAASAAGDETKR